MKNFFTEYFWNPKDNDRIHLQLLSLKLEAPAAFP